MLKVFSLISSVLFCIVVVLFIYFAVEKRNESYTEKINPNTSEIDTNLNSTASVDLIPVDISGGINLPSVYWVPSNTILSDLISTAGGFSPDADLSWIEKNLSLASKVTSGSKVYIPLLSDSWLTEATVNISDSMPESIFEGTSEVSQNSRISINTASAAELDELKGIGPKYAALIIQNRPYGSVDDFLERSGLPSNTAHSISKEVSFE
ncbi:MAG: helix-hairpin-helix domain-containing protein [Patescibacteria group bacterium]